MSRDLDDFDADFSHLPVMNLRCCRQSSPPGQGTFRPQGSGDWLMVYTHQGCGEATTPLGSARVFPRDILLYAPQDYQDYRALGGDSPWVHTWVHFVPKPHWLPFLQWTLDAQGLRIQRSSNLEGPELDQAFDRLNRAYWSHPRPFWKELSLNAVEEIILRTRIQPGSPGTTPMDPRIRRAMDWLVTHLTEPFSMEVLASQAGLSESALSHRFRQETGESPRSFQERCRLELARDLLVYSSDSITQIAFRIGFSSPFYFSKRYREHYGTSPSHTRNKGV